MPHILAVDDDPSITTLLLRGLRYEGFSVATAASAEEALNLALEHPPDLAILDIMLPGLDGLALLQRLRSADEQLPVLFLTGRDAPADQVFALEAGADDYVIKPFTMAVLLARVRALLRRRHLEQAPRLQVADLALDPAAHRVTRGSREVVLTSLEFTLLQAFLSHPRQVLSKEQLLDRVWGYQFAGSANVVEVYVSQLRQKLEAAHEPRLIHTLRGVGYVLREG
jgi:DNA-binding response OmpR family regulator